MAKTQQQPKTLMQAIRYFANLDVATVFLATLRWPNGVTCPACEAKNPGFTSKHEDTPPLVVPIITRTQ